MEEIKKESKREVVDTQIYYKAIDGTEFTSKEECIKYEDTVFCILMARAKEFVIAQDDGNGPVCLFDDNDDTNYMTLLPRDAKDIDTLNKLYILPRSNCSKETYFTEEHIGRPILMGYTEYDNKLEWNWFKEIDKALDRMTGGKFELKLKQ